MQIPKSFFNSLPQTKLILKKRLAIGGLMLCLIAGLHSPAIALEPTTIIYELELDSERFGKATLGRIETQLSQDGQQYSVATYTKAQGMAAILVGNFTESCEFKVVAGRAVSQHYSGGRPEKTEYLVGFDWDARKVNFNDKETLDMPQGYLVDNCNMPFALSLLQDQNIKETIYIVDGKKTRIRGYRFKTKSTEIINTKIGSLETIKIELERELKPEKTLTLWLSKKHHFLPVKMQEKREERITTMQVTEYSADT